MEKVTWRRPFTAFFANKRSLFMGSAHYFATHRPTGGGNRGRSAAGDITPQVPPSVQYRTGGLPRGWPFLHTEKPNFTFRGYILIVHASTM